jgi:hypothetical protein
MRPVSSAWRLKGQARGFVGRLQHGVRVLQEDQAFGRQRHAAAATFQQRRTQQAFEFGHRQRHRRLRQPHLGRGRRDLPAAGHGGEVVQLPQREARGGQGVCIHWLFNTWRPAN